MLDARTKKDLAALKKAIAALKENQDLAISLKAVMNRYKALATRLDEAGALNGRPLLIHMASIEKPLACRLVEFGTYQMLVEGNSGKQVMIYKSDISFIELGEKEGSG